ncbi:hypothetical protein [Amycolatopsis japonica]
MLTAHGITAEDARYIYEFRCELHHAYGIPNPVKLDGRALFATPSPDAYAVDTQRADRVVLSVPVFCGHLVERIAHDAAPTWPGTSQINTNMAPD